MAKGVGRGSLLGMAAQGWQMLTAFLVYAYLARVFGPTLFGSWTVVLSLLAWFEIFVTAGLVKVATKAISESPDGTPRLARAAYLAQALIAGVVFLAVEAGAGAIASGLGHPELAPLIRVSALDIPLFGAYNVASSVVLGRQRFTRQGVAWLVYATSKALLIVGLVAAGYGVAGALVGNALSSGVGLIAMFVRSGSAGEPLAELRASARWMLLAAAPFLAVSLFEGIVQQSDLWLVSAVVGDPARTGLYAAAVVLGGVPVFLFLGLNRVIFPSVAAAIADGDDARAGEYAGAALRTGVIITVLAIALAASMGRQAIEIVYSAAYLGAFVPLVVLMVAAMGRTLQATSTEVLMAEGRARSAMVILGVTVVVQVAVVSLFAARWGLVGAAAGAAVSALGAAAWATLALRCAIGVGPLLTLGRSVVAGGVVAVAAWFARPAPILLLVAVPLAIAAYAGLLALMREFSAKDLAAVRSGFGR